MNFAVFADFAAFAIPRQPARAVVSRLQAGRGRSTSWGRYSRVF